MFSYRSGMLVPRPERTFLQIRVGRLGSFVGSGNLVCRRCFVWLGVDEDVALPVVLGSSELSSFSVVSLEITGDPWSRNHKIVWRHCWW